ncbi:MAG: chemotaxis protein CheA [Candidatus Cloacimonetes bacterium]|nr:chemotaxis protein CheA [Candidatus Cloacimonadota bacterium]
MSAATVDYGVEPEVIEQFVDESNELLDSAANLFIILEDNPADEDAIHKVFRIVHTIKGNSAFFNLFKVKSLAHVLEDLMTAIRMGQISIDETIIDVLLEGIDKLKEMLSRVRESLSEVADEEALQKLIGRVEVCQTGETTLEHTAQLWKQAFEQFASLRAQLPQELETLAGSIENSLHKIAPTQEDDADHAGVAEAVPQVEQLHRLLSAKFSEPMPSADAEQALKLLTEIEQALGSEQAGPMSEMIEVYTATVPQQGFTRFLADLIIERLDPLMPVVGPTDSDVAAHLETLNRLLKDEFVEPLPPEKADEVRQALQAMIDALPEMEDELKDLLEVYDQTVPALGFGHFLKDLVLEKTEGIAVPTAPAAAVPVIPVGKALGEICNILENEFIDPLPAPKCEIVYNHLTLLSGNADEKIGAAAAELVKIYESAVESTGFTSFMKDIVLEKLKPLLEITTSGEKDDEPAAAGKSVDEARSKSDSARSEAKSGKTMRVAEASIDAFLDFVGELVVIGEMFTHVQSRLLAEVGNVHGISELRKSTEMFQKLSDDLQLSILEVRKVPMRNLTMRAPKMARDVASAKGKKVKVIIEGDETLIDKSLLEILDGPFAHLVRNSVDHGIEMPEKRVQSGKPEQGTLKILCRETDNDIFLEISDDGGGIPLNKIRAKAVRNGLHTEDEVAKMSDRQAAMLIFSAGLSTAEQVTDISGRGVGLDVVKKNVDKGNGRILVDTDLGKGTTITLQLPKAVTVKIVQGMMLEAGGRRFIVPIDSIGESFNVTTDMLTTVTGSGVCILRHDRVTPLLSLQEELDIGPPKTSGVGVTISVGDRYIVMLVDKVLGARKVVIKDINGFEEFSDCISGGAILGNEEVAIVLNPDAFVL